MENQMKKPVAAVPATADTSAYVPKNPWFKRLATGAAVCAVVVGMFMLGGAANSQRVVNVCSWGEYIDESLIDQFEEETGIRVNYQTAESNEALYSLLKSGGGDYDVRGTAQDFARLCGGAGWLDVFDVGSDADAGD